MIPSKLSKFQVNLHHFRAYDLPQLLIVEDTQHRLPSTCCSDFILWQCVIDEIIAKELQVSRCTSESTTKPRIVSHVEQNAIRYSAGYVIRKQLQKKKLDMETKECLERLLRDRDDETENDSSDKWLRTTDRGGLYHITDMAFELFTEIEIATYNQLSKKESSDTESLYKKACADPDVLSAWGECSIDIDSNDKQNSVLIDIVKEWVKMRGHSIASMQMEKHKKKKATTTQKKRSLRKELERQTAQQN